MDCTAAAHRLQVGVPATVEHSSEDGTDAAKWVAETTQVSSSPHLLCLTSKLMMYRFSEFHNSYGCPEAEVKSKRSTPSFADRFDERLYAVQG